MFCPGASPRHREGAPYPALKGQVCGANGIKEIDAVEQAKGDGVDPRLDAVLRRPARAGEAAEVGAVERSGDWPAFDQNRGWGEDPVASSECRWLGVKMNHGQLGRSGQRRPGFALLRGPAQAWSRRGIGDTESLGRHFEPHSLKELGI